MSTREWGVGYDEGYQQGWNDAMNEKPAEANEPVAYIEHHKAGDNLVWDNPGANSSPLYTTPPQRTWVGLTDEEIELLNDCGDTDSYKFARAIEARLKDKNNA